MTDQQATDQQQPAMRTYSKDDLLEALENEKHPAIRRIMGEMLYTMGLRDAVSAGLKS